MKRIGLRGDFKGYTRRKIVAQQSPEICGFGVKVAENKSRRLCKVCGAPPKMVRPAQRHTVAKSLKKPRYRFAVSCLRVSPINGPVKVTARLFAQHPKQAVLHPTP